MHYVVLSGGQIELTELSVYEGSLGKQLIILHR